MPARSGSARGCRHTRIRSARCAPDTATGRTGLRVSPHLGRRPDVRCASRACRRPRSHLGALVLRVADERGRPAERRLRRGGVEDELDHLPVALVLVVPVVERVVEPVLERELVLFPDDVRVRRRRLAGCDPVEPLLVAAARVEGVARKVEPVPVAFAEEVRRGRSRASRPRHRVRAARRLTARALLPPARGDRAHRCPHTARAPSARAPVRTSRPAAARGRRRQPPPEGARQRGWRQRRPAQAPCHCLSLALGFRRVVARPLVSIVFIGSERHLDATRDEQACAPRGADARASAPQDVILRRSRTCFAQASPRRCRRRSRPRGRR